MFDGILYKCEALERIIVSDYTFFRFICKRKEAIKCITLPVARYSEHIKWSRRFCNGERLASNCSDNEATMNGL